MSVFEQFNDYLLGDSHTIGSTNIMMLVSTASIHSLPETFAPDTPSNSVHSVHSSHSSDDKSSHSGDDKSSHSGDDDKSSHSGDDKSKVQVTCMHVK